MDQQQILDALAGLTLFSDLGGPQLQAVAHTMSEESFPGGQRILRQGFSGGGFTVILDVFFNNFFDNIIVVVEFFQFIEFF